MKFKSHLMMRSCPELKVDAKTEPIAFKSSIKGALNCHVGAIVLNVGEIPIRIAIPFLKERDKLPVAASFGGFTIKLNPFQINVENMNAELNGILGENGINSSMDCRVACKTSMDATGIISGKVAAAAFELEDEGLDDFEDICVKSA